MRSDYDLAVERTKLLQQNVRTESRLRCDPTTLRFGKRHSTTEHIMTKLLQAAVEPCCCRSFVDLRKFAADKSQGIEATGPADASRFLSSRRLLDWPAGPVSAGVIALDAGCGVVPPQPVDEFIIVAEGEIALTQADSELRWGLGTVRCLVMAWSFLGRREGPYRSSFCVTTAAIALMGRLSRFNARPSWSRRARLQQNGYLRPRRSVVTSRTTGRRMGNLSVARGIRRPITAVRCFSAIVS